MIGGFEKIPSNQIAPLVGGFCLFSKFCPHSSTSVFHSHSFLMIQKHRYSTGKLAASKGRIDEV
jgi:hypothetical protein